MALRGRQTKKTLTQQARRRRRALGLHFPSARKGALKPAPPLIVRLIPNGRAGRGRVQSDPGQQPQRLSSFGSPSYRFFASGNMVSGSHGAAGEAAASRSFGRARGERGRRRHSLPELPGLDEGLVLRWRRRDARARLRAPGRAGSDVARAPPGSSFPSPTRLLRPRGPGPCVQGARARPSGAAESLLGDARLDWNTRHPNLARGRRRKSARAVLARAPPKGCSCLSPRHPPLERGPSREQVAGCPRGRGGAAGGGMWGCPGAGASDGACTARHRAGPRRSPRRPSGASEPLKASRVRGVHPAETGTAPCRRVRIIWSGLAAGPEAVD